MVGTGQVLGEEGLLHRDQGEAVRRARREGGAGERHQAVQLRQEAGGQALDRGRIVPVGAVAPVEPKPAAGDAPHDLDPVRPGLAPVADLAGRLSRGLEQPPRRDDRVELAQVVEDHPGAGQGAERLRRRPAPEMAQDSEGEAAGRDRPQGLSDPLKRPRPLSAPVEEDREEGREPAHGPRHVEAGEGFVPSVPLEVDPQPAAPGPAGEGAGQGGEQDLLDPDLEGARKLLEQPPGLIPGQGDAEGPGTTPRRPARPPRSSGSPGVAGAPVQNAACAARAGEPASSASARAQRGNGAVPAGRTARSPRPSWR